MIVTLLIKYHWQMIRTHSFFSFFPGQAFIHSFFDIYAYHPSASHSPLAFSWVISTEPFITYDVDMDLRFPVSQPSSPQHVTGLEVTLYNNSVQVPSQRVRRCQLPVHI
jgi:hypothetical protein